MASYGKRFQQQSEKGMVCARVLCLQQDKNGYFITTRGPKTASAIYQIVKELSKVTSKGLTI